MPDTIVVWLIVIAIGILLVARIRRRKTKTATVNYLIPGEDDEPLTPREVFVAGVNRKGLSGIHRQKVIAKCKKGEQIFLVRQPKNPHDENAILLYRSDGADIGYLPAEIAVDVAPRLDRGSPATAIFKKSEPFETDDGKTLLGARVELTLYKLRRQASSPAKSADDGPGPFEPDGVYSGIPYKVRDGGKIEAMLVGGLVVFRDFDQFIASANGESISHTD